MSYTFTIHPEQRLILEAWQGEVTLGALIAGLERIEQHPDFDSAFDVLSDFSGASFSLSSDDLRRYEHIVRSRGFKVIGRRAAVSPGDLEFAVSRQAQALWDLPGLEVFRDRAAAEAWIAARSHSPDSAADPESNE